MLDLNDAALQARTRIDDRLTAASQNAKVSLPKSARLIQQGASFRAHLLEALRRGGDERTAPSPAPDTLFLAFPEKLLGKWYHLAFGPQRQTKGATNQPTRDADAWRAWDSLGTKTKITNFLAGNARNVLLAHGLAAIEDSVLLLADIGRASRAARAMNVPLRVLLADVSWISYNRSLKRFDLSDQEIEHGLRSCQAARHRIYEGVGIEVKVHAIVPYQKKGAISSQKIRMIAGHYLQLASHLWGQSKIESQTPLSNSEVAQIGRPLHVSLESDSPLQFLASFPGALPALENALGHHLSVVRTIAQRFRMLSEDTFSYYFAQYFAQDEYRGTHLKIAPESERDFDEPYDELDDSFRLWGDGHDPLVNPKKNAASKKRRMTGVYLPQYSLGDWKLLPYSPLSLDAVANSGGQVRAVQDKVILLSDCGLEDQPKVETLLRSTLARSGTVQLNRLLADILSFIQAIALASGRGSIDAACRRVGGDLDSVLYSFHRELPENFAIECEPSAPIGELWLSWLDTIDRTNRSFTYVPCHLTLSTLTQEDWSDDKLTAASILTLTATRIASDLAF